MAKTNEAGVDIGLDEAARKKAAAILGTALADTFTAYLKTHNYHWNVTGRDFHMLHTMFQGQYEELHDAVDEIAERIRALGFKAPGSLAGFGKLASIGEAAEGATADEMVRDLMATNEALARNLRKAEGELGELGDISSADLMVARVTASEKHAWMLRATLA
ncbi:Dps family protein [Zavarzinia sp.]|uniref:Dps family protein n=1 Tax=Zavarzinia sp. TaxID=2027920 RepID=UPI003BB63FAD